jgi:hypothetical protein
MLIPQYSLRWILGAMTLLAVVFLFVGQAVAGKHWAIGVSLAVLALSAAMLVHAGLFFVVWLFSQIFGPRSPEAKSPATLPARSPFASPAAADTSMSTTEGST